MLGLLLFRRIAATASTSTIIALIKFAIEEKVSLLYKFAWMRTVVQLWEWCRLSMIQIADIRAIQHSLTLNHWHLMPVLAPCHLCGASRQHGCDGNLLAGPVRSRQTARHRRQQPRARRRRSTRLATGYPPAAREPNSSGYRPAIGTLQQNQSTS